MSSALSQVGTDLDRAYVPTELDGPVDHLRRWVRARPTLRWMRSNGPLLCVLLLQTIGTVTQRNTAFQDEALYLYAGHRLIDLVLYGTPTYEAYSVYFSGAPGLYPVMAAALDQVGGLTAARGLSLACALGTTLLLYATSRRLFDDRSALIAAAIFGVTSPILFIGNLATYDATALFCAALATWFVVMSGNRRPWWILAAAAAMAIAFFMKYAVALYFPSVVAICGLAALPYRGWWRSFARMCALAAATIAPMMLVLYLLPALRAGLTFTTTDREKGSDTAQSVLIAAAGYIGLPLLLAVIGGVLWIAGRTAVDRVPPPAVQRVLLVLVLVGTAFAAPLQQATMETQTSLHKHVGFGLWFAVPLAGVALVGLLRRPTFSGPAIVLAICTVVAWMGISQSHQKFNDWPNSTELIDAVRTQVRPISGRYLVEESEVPRYYLRDLVEPYQWTGTYVFLYTDAQGNDLSGVPAYRAALSERHFDAVILRNGPTAALNMQFADLLGPDGGYVLAAELDATTTYGPGTWNIWVRR